MLDNQTDKSLEGENNNHSAAPENSHPFLQNCFNASKQEEKMSHQK
jgi:hypothetical protein